MVSITKHFILSNMIYHFVLVDLAVGAYQSGHAILFRAKPVVVLNHVLSSSVSQISAQNHTSANTDATAFNITSCVSFSGQNIHPPIGKSGGDLCLSEYVIYRILIADVFRTISVDKGVSDRAYLDGATDFDSKLLVPMQQYCQTYTVKIKVNNKTVFIINSL